MRRRASLSSKQPVHVTRSQLKTTRPLQIDYPFFDSATIKPFFDMDWLKWAFGSYCGEVGVIQIYMDNILKAYELFGKGKIEDWLCTKLTENLVHELIHAMAHDWSELQVERATNAIFQGDKP